MKKSFCFALFGLLILLLCAPLALADEGIDPSWYYGGADGAYALKTREYEAGFSYTPSPEDWRDRNIYQLFTDRFATDGHCNLDSYHPEWFYKNSCTGSGGIPRNFHQGGNWRGLRQQIPYLSGMGVTAVWISGVQLNDQAITESGYPEWRWTPYHQYHVDNFFSCDPASGTFQELKDLIDDLHAAHIAVILDVAPNHMCDKSGWGSAWEDKSFHWDESGAHWWNNSNKHPAPFDDLARFHVNGTINNWDQSPENLMGQFKGTDDLDQDDGTTSSLLYKAFKNLIDATDCDGFRVDAIKHIPYDWCRGWAQAMRDHAAFRGKNNFLVFGELFSYSHDALAGWCADGYGFNSSLDFPLMNAMKDAFGNGYNLGNLGNELYTISSKYGKSAQNVIAFLDNHDVDRFACTYGGGDKGTAVRIMKPAMTFLYLAPPIPLLYYGTEHCFNQDRHGNGIDRNGDESSGWYNPDDSDWQRECMFSPNATWGTQNGFEVGNAYGDMFSDGAKDAGLYYHIAWLNGLRNKSRALRRGGFQQRASVGGQGLYAFTKWYGDEVALVLLNTSDSEYSVSSYNSGWLEVGIKNAAFKADGTGEVVGTSNGEGWIDLSGVKLEGKGSKVLICNFVDNSADVGGSGGGGGSSLWANSTYVWPTEATVADTIYINTQVGNVANIQSVKVIYGFKGQEGAWPFEEMELNADWDPTQEGGAWYHYELPASAVSAGTLQFSICVSDGTNEVWDNNGGGDYLVTILPRPADIGATFASVVASPTAPTNGETATITAAMAKTGNDISQLAVKMSYAFETISGSVGTWTTVPMAKGDTFEDKTYFTASVENLPGGQTLLYKLEATNGGTDVLQANNGNAYRLKIVGDSTGTVGNCWHCPTNHEPPEALGCMRQPVTPKAGGKVTLWMGNYQGGDGTSGQPDPFDMTGGKVIYRFGAGDTWSAWESKDLNWGTRGGDGNCNNYWNNADHLITVPASADGKYLQYYFEAYYTNSAALATPTYLYMNPDNSGTSLTTTSEATAQATPFEVGIAANASGDEPGFIRHAGNLTRVADNKVQIWARIGYQPDTGAAWADEAVIRYRVDIKKEATRSSGVKALKSSKVRAAKSWKALTNQVSMTLQSTENDSSGKGKVMVWMGTIEDDLIADPDSVLIYEVYARNSKGNGNWKQAEYNAENGSCTFEYRMWSDGSGDLTVDGVPADYTTSKLFLDEADPDDEITVEVAYHAPDDADLVELFTNFGRRDHADDDTDGDGWPDGMIPPDGGKVTAEATYLADAGYWQAVPMTKGSGAYVKTLSTKKCGVYRITARYGYIKNGVTNWTWYSQNPDPEGAPRRDHVVVISPKKAMQQTMYELNVLTTKATADTAAGCGTFEGLSERLRPAATADADPYGEFSIDYLNRMGVNCLWFQPIHPNLDYKRGNTNEAGTQYKPGSPYGTKNYFSVNTNMSSAKTEMGAVNAFVNFVQLCDKAQSKAGETKNLDTINVMLDGVMNHTSFDAVFGEGIELVLARLSDTAKAELTQSLGSGWDNVTKTSTIPATKLGIQWYSHVVDETHNQAQPATKYVSVDNNDIANAPERYDFGKWNDVAELLYGDYSTMVKYNDMEEKWYQGDDGNWYSYTEMGPETSRIYSEEDQYYYGSMLPATKVLWMYMASYPEYWITKTGNDGVNHPGVRDENGTLTDDYGIDGLRCDYAQGLPNQFWEYTINRTRSKKWNFLFMAESLDGGKVGFRSNRQFDILNENMVFRFTQDHVSDPWQFQNELENRRNAYGNGLILLNETCHDEIIPWGDPQCTASRYAMVSAVDGIPMIFYGQEQAISTFSLAEGHEPDNGNKWVGFKKFESNFGKWIPHFKVWNKMLVWDDMVYSNGTPNASRDMAAFYGKINLARLKSPALQSRNRWFLSSDKDGNYIKKLMFCAKWEDEGKSPKDQDAVFAVALFLNDSMGENNELNGHWGEGATYDISPFAAKMGIENRADRLYNLKNIASTNTDYVWEEAKSGKELYENGLEVVLEGSWQWDDVNQKTNELPCSVWNDNGRVVQYLKVFDVTGEVPPVAPDGLTITDPVETAEVPFGTASYDVVGMAGKDIEGKVAWSNAANGATGSFDPDTVWTNGVTLAEGTNVVTFTAATKAGGTSVVAEDTSSNTAYTTGQEYNGLNGGSGFGAWTTLVNDQPSASQDGVAGHWTDANGFGLWCAWNKSSGAKRALPRALKAGDVFSIVFKNGDIPGKSGDIQPGCGFGLCSSTDDDAGFRFYFNGGFEKYRAVAGPGEGTDTTLGWTSGGVRIVVTMTSDLAFTATMTAIDGSGSATFSGTFTKACDMFRTWSWSNKADIQGNNYDVYVNEPKLVEASSGTGEPATATATIVVLPDAHADDIEVEIVAIPEVAFDAKTGKIVVSLEVEGEGVAALTTVTVWTADTLLPTGNWNWAPETAEIVDGELQFMHKMPTDKPLLISVGKPACVE